MIYRENYSHSLFLKTKNRLKFSFGGSLSNTTVIIKDTSLQHLCCKTVLDVPYANCFGNFCGFQDSEPRKKAVLTRLYQFGFSLKKIVAFVQESIKLLF